MVPYHLSGSEVRLSRDLYNSVGSPRARMVAGLKAESPSSTRGYYTEHSGIVSSLCLEGLFDFKGAHLQPNGRESRSISIQISVFDQHKYRHPPSTPSIPTLLFSPPLKSLVPTFTLEWRNLVCVPRTYCGTVELFR